MRRAVAIGLAATVVLASGASRLVAQERGWVVVVNEANIVSSLSLDELKRLFMRQTLRWIDGRTVIPLDLEADSPLREQFSQQVLQRSTTQVKAYWQTQVFSGRGTPPMEAPAEEMVLQFIRGNPGAIGYVSASATLPPGVRRVRVRG